jgi:hypothetical protein
MRRAGQKWMDSGSALSWPFYNMWVQPVEENGTQTDNEIGNHTGIGDVPNKPVSQIWPEAWFGGTEHLYIQMPSLPVCYTWNKSVISEFAQMNSEKSLVFIENSLKICYNPSCHAVA